MSASRPPPGGDPADHDGNWKDALDAYFEPCLRLFWPELHAEIDWSVAPAFRDKELQRLAGARRRGRRHIDKLAEVRLRRGRQVLLFIHLEVEARPNAAFLLRMYAYHYRLLDKHPGREVIHLAILTPSAGDGRRRTGSIWGCAARIRSMPCSGNAPSDGRRRWRERASARGARPRRRLPLRPTCPGSNWGRMPP